MIAAIVSLYHTFFYQPLFNLLVFIYNTLPGHDLAVAIAVLTILIRILLYPLSRQSIRAQKMMQDLQPKIDALKAQYKGEREKLAEATMKLYKAEQINPAASCLPLLIQLPFLLALFQVFQDGLNPDRLQVLYPFVRNPGVLNSTGFWGLLDLSHPSIPLALLAGLAQFWQGHMLIRSRPVVKAEGSKDEDFAVLMNKQMTYIMPFVTIVIAWRFPSGLALYWFLTTFLMAVQQWWVFRQHTKVKATAVPAA